MSKNTPLISVLMPAYNEESRIAESVESILSQTFSDFEFIVVDDASNDKTHEILETYASQDERLIIIRHEKNLGRPSARNTALRAARGAYIAIMDADDWAYPERLQKQYDYMQAHPKVTVCGSWVTIYEDDSIWGYPLENDAIKAQTLFNSMFSHPAVLINKKHMDAHAIEYNATVYAEDYELWSRLMVHNDVVFANISEILVRYRLNFGKMKKSQKDKCLIYANQVRRFLLKELNIEPSEKEFNTHLVFCSVVELRSLADIFSCFLWRRKLLKHAKNVSFIDECALRVFLKKRMWNILVTKYIPQKLKEQIRNFLKCIKMLDVVKRIVY